MNAHAHQSTVAPSWCFGWPQTVPNESYLLIFQLKKRRKFEIDSKNKAWPLYDRVSIVFN